MSLSKTLSAFSPTDNVKIKPVIKFGRTIDNVSLENLSNLLRVSQGKVTIDLEGSDLAKIYRENKTVAKLLDYNDAE